CNQVDNPAVGGVILNLRDVSERKKAEAQRRRLQERAWEAQKLETVGQLAGGVAHDFNNLLTSVLGYANLAGMLVPPGTVLSGYLESIEAAARRAAELCQQLLGYAGKGHLGVATV